MFNQGSRFIKGKTYTFREKQIIFEGSYDFSNIVKYYLIPAGQEYRPDLISLSVYKRPDLGWVIMRTNKLDHISQLTVNKSLTIPRISNVL